MQAFFEKHFYLVNLAVVGLTAILAGLVATSLIEYALIGDGTTKRRKPRRGRRLKKPKKPTVAALRKSMFDVTRRNIFCSYCKPAKVVDSGGTGGAEKPTVNMDDAELLATQVAVDDDKWSIATIRFKKTQRMRLVAKGSKIDEYEITKVESKRVTFKRGKETGFLELFPDAGKDPARVKPKTKPRGRRRGKNKWRDAVNRGVRKLGPNKYEIDRSLVQSFISNTAMAGRDAAIYPHTKNGKPDGFRLGRVRPGGIFAKLGMRSGDVLNSVNNMPISTLDKALEMFTKLQGANHMTIGLTRYGRPRTLDYSIK